MCHLVAHTTANTKLNYINAFSHRLRAFHLKASKYSIDSWGHFYFSKRTLTLRTINFFTTAAAATVDYAPYYEFISQRAKLNTIYFVYLLTLDSRIYVY